MAKTEWMRMTWKEISDLPRDTVVLLPVGACEQNGPHNPVGYDTIVAEYFVREVADRTDAVYLPAIPFGYSRGFSTFPGTIWLRPSSLQAVVEDVVSSLVEHGFLKLLAVVNHAPNEPMVEHALREASQEHQVLVGSLWPVGILKDCARQVFRSDMRLAHGGEPTTSVLKALMPSDIRMDLLHRKDEFAKMGPLSIESTSSCRVNNIRMKLYLDAAAFSCVGTMGDVEADADKGKFLLDRMVEKGAEIVTALASVEERPRVSERFRQFEQIKRICKTAMTRRETQDGAEDHRN